MIALLFSGQGAQKTGMGAELFESSSAAREVFAQLSDAMGRDIASLCFDGESSELNQTINTQAAVLAVDLAAWAALKERGVNAQACAGFSLGEYAAMVCAGVLSVFDAGKIVQARAKFMAECQTGGMAAVLGADAAEVEEICLAVESGFVAPVNYNCPGQTVIAGEDAALKEAIDALKKRKIRALPLRVSGAFHCRLMKNAADRLYQQILQGGYVFNDPQIPIVCNISAETFQNMNKDNVSAEAFQQADKENTSPETLQQTGRDWPSICRDQAMSAVLWDKSVRKLMDLGADTFIECGVGKVLTGLNKRICPECETHFVEDLVSLNSTVSALGCK